MPRIIGNTTATPNPQPDWGQNDTGKADYIKNKPDLTVYATNARVDAVDRFVNEHDDALWGDLNPRIQALEEWHDELDVYTKEETDEKYATKDNINVISSSVEAHYDELQNEIVPRINTLESKEVYTRGEVDAAIANVEAALTGYATEQYVQTELGKVAEVYTEPVDTTVTDTFVSKEIDNNVVGNSVVTAVAIGGHTYLTSSYAALYSINDVKVSSLVCTSQDGKATSELKIGDTSGVTIGLWDVIDVASKTMKSFSKTKNIHTAYEAYKTYTLSSRLTKEDVTNTHGVDIYSVNGVTIQFSVFSDFFQIKTSSGKVYDVHKIADISELGDIDTLDQDGMKYYTDASSDDGELNVESKDGKLYMCIYRDYYEDTREVGMSSGFDGIVCAIYKNNAEYGEPFSLYEDPDPYGDGRADPTGDEWSLVGSTFVNDDGVNSGTYYVYKYNEELADAHETEHYPFNTYTSGYFTYNENVGTSGHIDIVDGSYRPICAATVYDKHLYCLSSTSDLSDFKQNMVDDEYRGGWRFDIKYRTSISTDKKIACDSKLVGFTNGTLKFVHNSKDVSHPIMLTADFFIDDISNATELVVDVIGDGWYGGDNVLLRGAGSHSVNLLHSDDNQKSCNGMGLVCINYDGTNTYPEIKPGYAIIDGQYSEIKDSFVCRLVKFR